MIDKISYTTGMGFFDQREGEEGIPPLFPGVDDEENGITAIQPIQESARRKSGDLDQVEEEDFYKNLPGEGH